MTDTLGAGIDAVVFDGAAIDALRAAVHGDVFAPGDPGYDDARQAWNRAYVHRPAVVVAADDVADIVTAVRFAAEHGVGLGVQATGHGVTRTVDGGVLLLTGRLTGVSIDPAARTAWVAAGSTWGPVLAAAQDHGLAPVLGSSSHVGAVGYTLGGGVGWLARKYGAAADSVRAFEVVVPDGRLVRASADENVELFRALRGGGGGTFGVVTGMEISLYPVTTVYGGNLLYPIDSARDVVTAWVEWVVDAPDELTSEVMLINYPPMPELPEAIRGKSFAIMRGCWCGPVDEGRALLDEWRRRMPPMVDLWDEMSFRDVDTISSDPVDPLPALLTGGWMRDVDRDVADTLARATFVDGPPPLLFSEIRHLGGAVRSGDRAHSVLGNRDESFLFHALGLTFSPEMGDALQRHLAALRADLGAHLAPGVYLNFVDGEERRGRAVDAVDPADLERVRAVKRELDPGDVLRFGVDYR